MPLTRASDAHDTGSGAGVAVKERGELFGHGPGQLFGVGDGNGALIVAGHVMADTDGEQLDLLAFSTIAMTSRRCFSK